MKRSILVVGLWAMAGCSSGSPDASGRPQVDTLPGGVVVIDNSPLISRVTVAPWTLTEDLRIGASDGAGPAVFGEIYFFAIDADGSLFILDGQAQELRHFDRSGVFVATVASKGAGPGELAGGYGVIWDPEGNLITTDIGNRRYTVLNRGGEVLATHMRTIGGVIYPWLARFMDSRLLEIGLVRPGSGPGNLGTYNRFQFLHWNLDYTRQDTLGYLDYPILQVGERRVSQPFAPRATLNITDSGTVWFTNNHEYRFIERTLAGDTIRIVTLPLEPTEVTLSERDSIVDQFTQFNISIDRSEVYPTKPLVRRLVPTTSGGLLVLPYEYTGGDGAVIDVFGASGEYEGRVTSPVSIDHMPPPQLHGDYLYAVAKDELDVEYLVRLRIDPGS